MAIVGTAMNKAQREGTNHSEFFDCCSELAANASATSSAPSRRRLGPPYSGISVSGNLK
jgi:hypothetical protein